MLGRSKLARATALAVYALSSLASSADKAAAALRTLSPRPTSSRKRGRMPVNPFSRLWGRSKYMPHQGKRECARRRGGDDWANFKARDRIRRGLPVSWPYQGMEG